MGFVLIVPMNGENKYFEDRINMIHAPDFPEDHFSGKLPFDEEDK